MTNKQVIQTAIERAVEGGFGLFSNNNIKIVTRHKKGIWGLSINDEDGVYGLDFRSDTDLLFDHDFARALFGEGNVCINCGKNIEDTPSRYCGSHKFMEESYLHHLHQLALSTDRIEYITNYLKEK